MDKWTNGQIGKSANEQIGKSANGRMNLFAHLPICLFAYLPICMFALLFLMGCAQWRAAIGEPEGDATVAITLTPTEVAATATAIPTPAMITLTIWTSEEFAPTRGDEAGAIMETLYESFTDARSDVVIQHRLKKPYGKGGLLDFLVTTSAVVPQLLPDVVIIDIAELGAAARSGVLSPLDNLLSAKLQEDLFPWTRAVGTVEGQWVGLPFVVELEHLAYPSDKLAEPPATWNDVLTGEEPYIFPAGGEGGLVNAAFLAQYWALGGELLDDVGNPSLNLSKVEQILGFYKTGYDSGVFVPSPMEFNYTDEGWEAYIQTELAVTHISSRKFMTERAAGQNLAFGAVPTQNGGNPDSEPIAVGRGWAVAITTKDGLRLPIAASFVENLFAAEMEGRWCCATNYLPTRRAAFACFESDDEYIQFIQMLLEHTRFRPYGKSYTKVATALQAAVEAVLQDGQTPAQAIEEVSKYAN